jgi:hypothetical protein
LCFLWGMNWIYICCVKESRPPLWSSGQSSWLQNGEVLWFLWGTKWIYICCVEESRPPLWSSGQSSWLQNGEILWFLWGTKWIYICCVEESRPPLWSSGQSSWLLNGEVLCFLWGTNWIYMLCSDKVPGYYLDYAPQIPSRSFPINHLSILATVAIWPSRWQRSKITNKLRPFWGADIFLASYEVPRM